MNNKGRIPIIVMGFALCLYTNIKAQSVIDLNIDNITTITDKYLLRDRNVTQLAYTKTFIETKYEITAEKGHLIVNVYARAFLNINESWLGKGLGQASWVMMHEKGHCLIALICSMEIEKQLNGYTAEISLQGMQGYVENRIEYIKTQYRKYNELYEKATANGNNMDIQQEWNTKLHKLLESLSTT